MKKILWKFKQRMAVVLSVSMLLACISPLMGLAKEFTGAPIGSDPVNDYEFELPKASITVKPSQSSYDVSVDELKVNNEVRIPFRILVDFGDIASPGNASASDWEPDIWADQIASELEFNPGFLEGTKETAEKLGAVVSVEQAPYTLVVRFEHIQEQLLSEKERVTVVLNPNYSGGTYPNVDNSVTGTNPGIDINITNGPAGYDGDYIPVEDPSWIENYPGWAGWNNKAPSEEEKESILRTNVRVYRNGELLTATGGVSSSGYRKSLDVREFFTESGTYTFQASFNRTNNGQVPDQDEYWSEESASFECKLPDKAVSVPRNLRWKPDGTVAWDRVPEKDAVKYLSYYVRVYVKNEENGEFERLGTYFRGSNEEMDVSSKLEADKTYKFRVMAEGDLIEYANSEFSAFSEEFVMNPIKTEGENLINNLLNTDDVKDAVENTNLSETDKGTLKLAVQVYETVAKQYEELEKQYKEKAGKSDFAVEMTEESGVDTDNIKVTGGILNGAAGIRFEKPQEQDLTDASVSKYRKRYALNITLSTPSDASTGELKYPVLITMPVPENLINQNIDPENLVIIHVKHDGGKEHIYPRVNEDGTVSFAVTEFSAFFFVDSTSTSGSGGSGGSGGGGSSTGSAGMTITDIKKGQVNSITGIITGTGAGYSQWISEAPQAEGESVRWKLKYADGTFAAGSYVTDEQGNPVKDAAGNLIEQPLWELINGAWYAFGVDGYAKSGMIFDPAQNGWFCIDINVGMKTGWQQIDGKWYYFNTISDGSRGIMYVNRMTPDGYKVNEAGVWEG